MPSMADCNIRLDECLKVGFSLVVGGWVGSTGDGIDGEVCLGDGYMRPKISLRTCVYRVFGRDSSVIIAEAHHS